MSDEDRIQAEAELARVVGELRAEVPVRAAWRDELHRALHAEMRGGDRRSASDVPAIPARPGRPRTTTWRIRPLVALAAAAGFTMLGATGGTVFAARATRAVYGGGDDVGVRFAVMAPGVKQVNLVGDFNDWDPRATPLTASRDGDTWSIVVPLSTGRHTYAFVIDGEIVADPTAPPAVEDDFGTPSSLLLVSNAQP